MLKTKAALEVTLSRPQSIAYKAAFAYRFLFVCAGRRGGKTFLLRCLLIAMAAKPNQNVWYVAPTYRMAKRLMWGELKKAAPPALVKNKNETDMTISFVNGSQISLFGADNPDSLVGDGIDACIIDEAALIRKLKDLADRSISPALSDRLGRLIMATTPRGFNYFWQLCSDCFNFPKKFPAHPDRKIAKDSYFVGYTSAEGGRIKKEELARQKNKLDAQLYRQEYDASFEQPGDLVYDQFSEANLDDVEIIPGRELLVGMDFNVNPMSAAIGQEHKGELIIFDEITIHNGNTEMMCQELRRRYPQYPIIVYPDPSGKARKTSASVGVTDFSIIQSHGFGLVAPDKAPLVVDRVNAVNAMLCSAGGQRRLIVNPECRTIVTAFQSQQNVSGTRIPDKLEGFDHVMDAIGYLVWMRFNLLVGEKPYQHSTTTYR